MLIGKPSAAKPLFVLFVFGGEKLDVAVLLAISFVKGILCVGRVHAGPKAGFGMLFRCRDWHLRADFRGAVRAC